MRGTVAVAAAVAMAVAGAAADERREHAPHEHGRSTLSIAIEGPILEMELAVPGMDSLGFEHAPRSEAERAAARDAEALLADPLALFALPSAAGCAVTSATVTLVTDSDEHAHGEHAEGEAEDAEEPEERHAEHRATYRLSCADPRAIDSIRFAFFERLPRAERLDVTLASERGQTRFEVRRGAPRIALGGLI